MQSLKFFKKKFLVLSFSFALCALNFTQTFAQDTDLEFTLDVASNTVPLPKIFKPNVDLSGRGFQRDPSWPQNLAAPEALELWQKDIGFSGVYRLQYNLWEIHEAAKDKDLQEKLLSNYEGVIKRINDSGGIVILNLFGTPAGLGKVLDKKSAPFNLGAFKELIKSHIKTLSCDKRYNIWYEVWNAPDLDSFFLGRKQEYFNIYKAVAEGIKELEHETKVFIPVGGPSVTWWFQDLDGNTIVTPERSLIYDLIKFCAANRLPLDFISWHAYSTDPKPEKEITRYNKEAVGLARDWLSYFNFDRNTPLIVDEWNYDREANRLPERQDKSYICASYIPARLKTMHEAGLDYQVYFSLEDFQNNKEDVDRNVGVFGFDPEFSTYKGYPKSTYNVFRMLANLGNNMFGPFKLNDEFVGVIATKGKDYITMLIYNYIDPEIVRNYLSRNIAGLNEKERRILLKYIKSETLAKIINRELNIAGLRATPKLKALLKKAQELNGQAKKFSVSNRNLKIGIKNLKEDYLYSRYTVSSSCSINCEFSPTEEKEISPAGLYEETLNIEPYSLNLIILKKKPPAPTPVEQPVQDTLKSSP